VELEIDVGAMDLEIDDALVAGARITADPIHQNLQVNAGSGSGKRKQRSPSDLCRDGAGIGGGGVCLLCYQGGGEGEGEGRGWPAASSIPEGAPTRRWIEGERQGKGRGWGRRGGATLGGRGKEPLQEACYRGPPLSRRSSTAVEATARLRCTPYSASHRLWSSSALPLLRIEVRPRGDAYGEWLGDK
jgi:hypothetical protein